MATILQQNTALSDSLFKRRPPSDVYYRSDANTLRNNVQEIEAARIRRQMKFPTLCGRGDVDSFKDPQNPTDPAFVKYNDEGEYRANAPFRACDNIIDPTSGFISVGGDVDRNTGHMKISPMAANPTTPQAMAPQDQHLIRPFASAPPELRRLSENDPGAPYGWNSRKVNDAKLRSMLGGWTSDKDPRKAESDNFGVPRTPADDNRSARDKLALKFMYTSSTQKGYEDVPWDNMISTARRWPPVTTLEPRADQISHRFNDNPRYAALPMEYQTVGRSWDTIQSRRHYTKKNIPIPGNTFISPYPRAGHIPSYSGHIGGVNLVEIDNPDEPFVPHTMKRVTVPRPTDTSHRPNIPNYSGCTWYRSSSIPMHSNNDPLLGTPQTTAVHRPMYVTPNDSLHKRESKMSKMVTTVPPGNPFNKIDKQPVDLKNPQQSTRPNSPTKEQVAL